jgi:glycosyltransferase involved in cell wall biosynthesis
MQQYQINKKGESLKREDTTHETAPIEVTPLPTVTAIILTYNEEVHIERAILCVKAFCSDIIVVDSYSTDRTAEIATRLGARVLQNPWTNYAKQFQWGMDHGKIRSQWILRLDADEIIGSDLASEIQQRLPKVGSDVAGVIFQRRHIFMGKWIRHGGRYPLNLLRLWRNGQGRVEDRWMDEHVIVWGGSTVTFKGRFDDAAIRDLTFFTTKHNGYSTREAIDVLGRKYGLFGRKDDLLSMPNSKQATMKRWIKQSIYNRLPFWAGPLSYFIFRYIFQFGFLDGRQGLIYHFLQGFWYRFLVNAKLLELDSAIAGLSNNENRIKELALITGLKLESTE